MQGFWSNLPKPFFALAPLANVTDAAFRRVIAKHGKPDVMYTEFVSADGLAKGNREILMRDLIFTEAERPIVAQFFTSTPKHMEEVARLARELSFDGVDINMGCPDRAVEKQGAGAALMKNPALAREIIRAAKSGAGQLPVSVKTRIGFNKDELEAWLPEIFAEEPAAVIIHARTRKEMSKVPAQWEAVRRAVEIRNALGAQTLIVGNGDATDLADARQKAKETGADGVMLGRAIFGNPFLFSELGTQKRPERPEGVEGQAPIEEKLRVLVEHIKLFEELLGDIKNFAIMKKHFKAYIKGFPACAGRDGAKELRVKLMEAADSAEVVKMISTFLATGVFPTRVYTGISTQ